MLPILFNTIYFLGNLAQDQQYLPDLNGPDIPVSTYSTYPVIYDVSGQLFWFSILAFFGVPALVIGGILISDMYNSKDKKVTKKKKKS